MSKNKKVSASLSIEDVNQGVDRNKAMIKNLLIFYAILFPICLVATILMFTVGDGAYVRQGYTLAILCVLCTVFTVMAYVRRKRLLNELVRQQKKKNKK